MANVCSRSKQSLSLLRNVVPANPLCCLKLYPFPQSTAGLYIFRPFLYLGHIFHQVMDCSMPLIGDHQVEDRQLITDLVISRMNQLLSRTPALSPQRPLTTQQPQVRNCKDAQHSHEPLLQTLWLKKKQRSDTYRPSWNPGAFPSSFSSIPSSPL